MLTRDRTYATLDDTGNVPFSQLGNAPGGEAGAGEFYHHVQSAAATTWTVNHGMGRHPVVSVLDSAGSQVEVSVSHVSLDQLVLTLSYAVSGTADCS
jgi:hypothetical protein